LKEYLQFVSTLPHVKTDKDYRRLFKSPPERIVMTDANFLQGNIGIMTFEPLSQEALNILVRFAKVFEFTYTRFLDLQKAEAQAREAQIEATLERVRARAMAMHNSEELADVIAGVFEQLQSLGFDVSTCQIVIAKDEDLSWQWWGATTHQTRIEHVRLIPFFEHPFITHFWEAREQGEAFFADSFGGKQKDRFFQWIFENTAFRDTPEERKKYIFESKKMARSVALMRHGALAIQNYDGVPYSEEENTILQRFARVFQQTYTRFLDLQKAEAQAREAQIEAALERVRAKSMAMHKSDELFEVVHLLFDQLENLGLSMELMTPTIIIFGLRPTAKTIRNGCIYLISNIRFFQTSKRHASRRPLLLQTVFHRGRRMHFLPMFREIKPQ
jgi:hypothetical protein